MTLKKIINLFFKDSAKLIPIWFFVIGILVSINFKLYKGDYRWDAAGYYAYLPATFLYQDFSFKFSKEASYFPESDYISRHSHINKYGVGVSILQSPFFMLGWIHSALAGESATGYWPKFKFKLAMGALFYGALGLYFLGLLLRLQFSPMVSNLTLISIGFATNLSYYTLVDYMLSHVYSFFLFSLAMYVTHRWTQNLNKKYFFALSLIFGLIASVRLTNILFMILPLFWGVKSFADFKTRLQNIFRPFSSLLIALVIFLIPLLPQLAYIYSQAGTIISPYLNEPFYWRDPLVAKVLLSYRAGWVLWSPVLLFSFVGWFWGRKHVASLSVLIFMIINLYVISSWWCWWYGGGFGMRALIESSAPMSFGLAYFYQALLNSRLKYFALILIFFITLNVTQIIQYKKNIIHFDAMTKKAYWSIFGKFNLTEKERKNLDKQLHKTNAFKTRTDREYRKSL